MARICVCALRDVIEDLSQCEVVSSMEKFSPDVLPDVTHNYLDIDGN